MVWPEWMFSPSSRGTITIGNIALPSRQVYLQTQERVTMATASYPIQVDAGASQALRRATAGTSPVRHRRPGERRSNQRFELALELDLFQLRGAKRLAWFASGTTVDWSRTSILLQCSRNLAAGSSAQLVVRWTAGVQLIVVGRVIRADERGMVIKILRRRFRGRPVSIVSLAQLVSWRPSGRPN